MYTNPSQAARPSLQQITEAVRLLAYEPPISIRDCFYSRIATLISVKCSLDWFSALRLAMLSYLNIERKILWDRVSVWASNLRFISLTANYLTVYFSP